MAGRGLFEYVGQDLVENTISSFSKEVSSNLIPSLVPILTVGLAIYYILKGYLVMTGRSQDPVMETLIHGFKVALIAYIALNVGNFISYGIEFISDCEKLLLSSLPGSPSNAWASIDQLWMSYMKIYNSLLDGIKELKWTQIAFIFLLDIFAFIFLIVALFLSCANFGVLLITKISLALVVGFGPLFFSFLMFPITRSWFDGWLKTCLSYLMTMVIFSAFLMMLTYIVDAFMTNYTSMDLSNITQTFPKIVENLAGLMIVSVAAATMVKSLPGMASGLIGGVALGATGIGKMMQGVGNGAVNATAAGKLMGGIASAAKSGGSLPSSAALSSIGGSEQSGVMSRVLRGIANCR